MVRIIKGVYGYVDKDGIPSPKTPKDKPFSMDSKEEQRLVDLGVAVFVGEPKVEVKAEEPETKKPSKKPKKKANKKVNTEEEPPKLSAVEPE